MEDHQAIEKIEFALIELQYLSADELLGGERQPAGQTSRQVAAYYHAACTALETCLLIIRQAEVKKSAARVA